MNKKMLFAAVVGAAISFIVVYLTFAPGLTSDGVATTNQDGNPINKGESPQARVAQATHASNSPAAAALERKRNFLDEYNKARSYRAFLYDVLRDPKKGGLSYALAALFQCKKAIGAAANPVGQSEPKLHAATALAARCDMSESEWEDVQRQLVAARDIDFNDDANLKLNFALLQAKTPEERTVAVAAIIQNGDPSVMRGILDQQLAAGDSNAAQPRVYFHDQWYQGAQNVDKFNFAFQLVECQLGMGCGADSTTALVLCSEKGWCGGSVQDAIRQQLNGQSPGKFDEVSALAAQILQQIQAGNVAAFVHR